MRDMQWKCGNHNHPIWTSKYNTVVNEKRWCPECGKDKLTLLNRNINGLELAKNYALFKGGSCLSVEYISNSRKMLWKCSNPNHKIWSSTFATVVSGNCWCPECKSEKSSVLQTNVNGLECCNYFAKIKGGQCLSNMYIGTHYKMEWKCADLSHSSWFASHANVCRGSWCPECGKNNLSENKLRVIVETFFGEKFPNSCTLWNSNEILESPFLLPEERVALKHKLKNKKRRLLELDLYCEDLGVAFEYDGHLHFEPNGRIKDITRRLKIFSNIKLNDHLKELNCQNYNVKLFRIPELPGNSAKKFQPFLNHVKHWCKEQGLELSFTKEQLEAMEEKFYKI